MSLLRDLNPNERERLRKVMEARRRVALGGGKVADDGAGDSRAEGEMEVRRLIGKYGTIHAAWVAFKEQNHIESKAGHNLFYDLAGITTERRRYIKAHTLDMLRETE